MLEVIEREKLQANSLKIGPRILAGLEQLKAKHKIIGDVRGKGLMLGIELVKDRATKEPAKAECAQVLENCRDMGLLLGKGGLQVRRFASPRRCACTNKTPSFCWMYWIERLAPSETSRVACHRSNSESIHAHTKLNAIHCREGGEMMHLARKIEQAGATGYMLLWLLGIPIPILILIFLLRGCT